MARTTIYQPVFGPLVNKAPINTVFNSKQNPTDGSNNCSFGLLNVRLQDGVIYPRRGYRNLFLAPSEFQGSYGFYFAEGYNNTTYVSEYVSIEDINGVVKPYKVNNDGSRTELTNIGNPVVMEQDRAIFNVFNGDLITITPNSAKTAYKYTIGTANSWTPLANSDYTPVPNNPVLQITSNPQIEYRFDSSDVFNYNQLTEPGLKPGYGFSTPGTDGVVGLTGLDNESGATNPFRALITITFGATGGLDWSGYDYGVMTTGASTIFYNWFTDGVAASGIQVQTGGVWRDVDYEDFTSTNRGLYSIVFRTKGLTGANAVQGIRFYIKGLVKRYTSGVACYFEPIQFGTCAITSTASSMRPWTTGFTGYPITYAARYKTGSTYSTISSNLIDTAQSLGPNNGYSSYYGATIGLSVAQDTSWSEVEFLRLVRNTTDTWKILSTVPASGSPQFVDIFEEWELNSLTTAASVIGEYPVQPPAFQTEGIKCATSHKGWFVWGFAGGSGNVRHSEVGNAYSLFDSDTQYDPEDLTQPANFTLAENLADEPVALVSTGEMLFIFGSRGVYGQRGDYPSQMTPCRKISNSNGIVGPWAAARFAPDNKGAFAVYMDVDGRVFALNNIPSFETDTTGDPMELTLDVGFSVRDHLLNQDGGYQLQNTQAVVNINDQSLWFILGKRAAIFRTEQAVTPGWELYSYDVRNPEASTCTALASGASYTSIFRTSDTNAASGIAWVNPNNAASSNNTYATNTFSASGLSELLRMGMTGLTTNQRLQVRLEHKKSGESYAYMDSCYFLVNGSRVGNNLANVASSYTQLTSGTSYPLNLEVPENDTSYLLTLTSAIPSGSTYGFEIGYKGTVINPDAFNPAYWEIGVTTSGTRTSSTPPDFEEYPVTGTSGTIFADGSGMFLGGTIEITITGEATVTATYIGPGDPPPYVILVPSCEVTANSDGGSFNISADNGLGSGEVISGPVNNLATSSGSKRVRASVTGGVASYTFQFTALANRTFTSGELQDEPIVDGSYSVSGSISTPTPAVISVDEVAYRTCSFTSEVVTGIGWDYLTYDPREDYRNIRGIRKSGQIDELERNSSTQQWIEGTGRDAGNSIQELYYQLQPITQLPNQLRLVYFGVQQVNATVSSTGYRQKLDRNDNSISVSAFTDDTQLNGTSTTTGLMYRFDPHKAYRIIPQITLTEDARPITAASLEITILSRSRY